jgi:3-deoxy-D-manno-octulosonate 8-phosphate phosphatase (KDO 8-P phosphatase)
MKMKKITKVKASWIRSKQGERDLILEAKKLKKKLEPIKLFLMDVDGILTNGLVYYSGQEIGFNRYFHVLDGHILKVLMKSGIKVGVISGGDSIGLRKRVELLNLDYMHLGDEDKRYAFLETIKDAGCEEHEVLYMGDEFFDIPLMERAGFSATVPHASYEVKAAADYITFREGGMGAVREVADLLRYAKGLTIDIPDFNEA